MRNRRGLRLGLRTDVFGRGRGGSLEMTEHWAGLGTLPIARVGLRTRVIDGEAAD